MHVCETTGYKLSDPDLVEDTDQFAVNPGAQIWFGCVYWYTDHRWLAQWRANWCHRGGRACPFHVNNPPHLALVMFVSILCFPIYIIMYMYAHIEKIPVNPVMRVLSWSNAQQPFFLLSCWPTVHYCKCACNHVMSQWLCVFLCWITANFWQRDKGRQTETKRISSLNDQTGG